MQLLLKTIRRIEFFFYVIFYIDCGVISDDEFTSLNIYVDVCFFQLEFQNFREIFCRFARLNWCQNLFRVSVFDEFGETGVSLECFHYPGRNFSQSAFNNKRHFDDGCWRILASLIDERMRVVQAHCRRIFCIY